GNGEAKVAAVCTCEIRLSGAAYRIALKLRATRSPAQGCGTNSVPRQGHNTPLPSERSPPASFKRTSESAKRKRAHGVVGPWRGPADRKGVGLLLPLTSDSTANDLHAPLRALTAPELPSEGGGPLVLPASRETTRR